MSSKHNTVLESHRPLKVHFIITSLPVGGAEVLLLNLLREMDRKNFEPEVICLKEPGAMGDAFAEIATVHSGLLRSKWDLNVLWRLRRLLRERESDAVITVGAGDKMFWGRLAAWLASTPVVCSALHSTGWPDGVGRLNRLLTPITHGFIACAEGHAGFLKSFEKFPADSVFTVRNGVDTSRFCPQPERRSWLRDELQVSPTTQLVGIVAALRPEKNHSQFVQAAKEVIQHHPDAHFVVVGEGPERQRIETEIAQLGMEGCFHLLGNRNDTPEILAGLDVFCLTSRNEANPVSILEALACGVPVVAPKVGSIDESVIDGETGYLTEPLNADSTARALTRLLNDPAISQELGAGGRDLVVRQASLRSMVSGYQDLVERLFNLAMQRRGLSPWRRAELPCESQHLEESDLSTKFSPHDDGCCDVCCKESSEAVEQQNTVCDNPVVASVLPKHAEIAGNQVSTSS